MRARLACALLSCLLAGSACAAEPSTEVPDSATSASRNGREIYERFRDGLAEPNCADESSSRWRAHFAHAPGQLAANNDDVLPLFGYVVDAVREADLPTEFALIPFVESGYKPAARSPQGPAGLWQMIAVTARNHKVPMQAGYDGRLSPIDSTSAAVRYLKTLYGMFAGDWRLAVMAYNAGEYRVLGALKRAGQTARDASPEKLTGLSPITHAYVRKLHALSCLMEQAQEREAWRQALDRPVPLLRAVSVPEGTANISSWAKRTGQDPSWLQRLNPAYTGGRLARINGKPPRLLAAAEGMPMHGAASGAASTPHTSAASTSTAGSTASTPSDIAAAAPATGQAADATPAGATSDSPRRHTVAKGDNASTIARRYGIRLADLLSRNGLTAASKLRPGRILLIDAQAASGEMPAAATTP